MLKKVIITLLTILSLLVSSIPAFAANEEIKVYIDGRQIYFDKQPFIENDVTLVQFRPIFEKLGLKIEWDEKTRTVTGRRSDLIVKLVIDDTSAIVNDERRELVIAPRIVDGNTMVPLRFVSEASGKKVNWDGDTRVIVVGEKSSASGTVTGDVYGTSDMDGNSKFGKPIEVEPVKIPDQTIVKDNKSFGSVKGAITWQYNTFIGTKPDTGAKIFLIPTNFDKNSVTEAESMSFGSIGSVPKGKKLFFAKANGYGNYEINNIPTGKYIIIISSNKTTRDFNKAIDDYDTNLLKSLIRDYEHFEIMNLKLNKYMIRTVEVNANQIKDFSYDFGFTYI